MLGFALFLYLCLPFSLFFFLFNPAQTKWNCHKLKVSLMVTSVGNRQMSKLPARLTGFAFTDSNFQQNSSSVCATVNQFWLVFSLLLKRANERLERLKEGGQLQVFSKAKRWLLMLMPKGIMSLMAEFSPLALFTLSTHFCSFSCLAMRKGRKGQKPKASRLLIGEQ